MLFRQKGVIAILKSCQYCGLIHPKNHICSKKPTRSKSGLSDAEKFRKTYKWTKKSAEIRKRDKGLCQICIRNLYNTQQQYTFDTVEVHHIVPLHEDIRMGLVNTNLLSLCKYHHYMADHGDIPRDVQHDISKDQEYKNRIM